ncbi:MAG: hypothetical protein ACOY7T_08140 [Pseudomonadota bacterium]
MADNPQAFPASLKRGDLEIIRKVRATNGGGYSSERIPRAALKRLLQCGAIRFKSVSKQGNLSTPDHAWQSRRAQAGYVIHGPNAAAMLNERQSHEG